MFLLSVLLQSQQFPAVTQNAVLKNVPFIKEHQQWMRLPETLQKKTILRVNFFCEFLDICLSSLFIELP